MQVKKRRWSSGYDGTLPTSRPEFDSRTAQFQLCYEFNLHKAYLYVNTGLCPTKCTRANSFYLKSNVFCGPSSIIYACVCVCCVCVCVCVCVSRFRQTTRGACFVCCVCCVLVSSNVVRSVQQGVCVRSVPQR